MGLFHGTCIVQMPSRCMVHVQCMFSAYLGIFKIFTYISILLVTNIASVDTNTHDD